MRRTFLIIFLFLVGMIHVNIDSYYVSENIVFKNKAIKNIARLGTLINSCVLGDMVTVSNSTFVLNGSFYIDENTKFVNCTVIVEKNSSVILKDNTTWIVEKSKIVLRENLSIIGVCSTIMFMSSSILSDMVNYANVSIHINAEEFFSYGSNFSVSIDVHYASVLTFEDSSLFGAVLMRFIKNNTSPIVSLYNCSINHVHMVVGFDRFPDYTNYNPYLHLNLTVLILRCCGLYSNNNDSLIYLNSYELERMVHIYLSVCDSKFDSFYISLQHRPTINLSFINNTIENIDISVQGINQESNKINIMNNTITWLSIFNVQCGRLALNIIGNTLKNVDINRFETYLNLSITLQRNNFTDGYICINHMRHPNAIEKNKYMIVTNIRNNTFYRSSVFFCNDIDTSGIYIYSSEEKCVLVNISGNTFVDSFDLKKPTIEFSCVLGDLFISDNKFIATDPNINFIAFALEPYTLVGFAENSQVHIYYNTFINSTKPFRIDFGYTLEQSGLRLEKPVKIYLNSIFAKKTSLSDHGYVYDWGGYGNYWSCFNVTDRDGDGIGDEALWFDGDSVDRFPLVRPHWEYNVSCPILVEESGGTDVWFVVAVFGVVGLVVVLVAVFCLRKYGLKWWKKSETTVETAAEHLGA